MDLISTVYVSSAVKQMKQAELVELLRAARDKNAAAGLTGMLLFHDGNFMQVLEGEPEAVDALLTKIHTDPRHAGVMVLLRQPNQSRSFGEWQMAFRNTNELTPLELAEVSKFLHPTFQANRTGPQTSAAVKLIEVFRTRLR
jgi:hypothetical protein